MKSLLIITIVLITSGSLISQNRIELKDGYVIKKATLHRINENSIEYLKNGSLHDLLITEIKRIYKDDMIIEFDESNKPLYFNDNYAPLKMEKPDENKDTGAIEEIAPVSSTLKEQVSKDENISIIKNDDQIDYAILISPFSYFEGDPNHKFTAEFKVGESNIISQSLGVCFNSSVSLSPLLNSDNIKFGIVLNTGVKTIMNHDPNKNSRPYYMFEFIFKNVSYYDTYYHYYSPDYYSESYYQTLDFVRRKYVTCYNFVLGSQNNYKNFVVDVFCGFGIRFQTIKNNRLKDFNDYDNRMVYEDDFHNEIYKHIYPNIKAGIRIGFGGRY